MTSSPIKRKVFQFYIGVFLGIGKSFCKQVKSPGRGGSHLVEKTSSRKPRNESSCLCLPFVSDKPWPGRSSDLFTAHFFSVKGRMRAVAFSTIAKPLARWHDVDQRTPEPSVLRWVTAWAALKKQLSLVRGFVGRREEVKGSVLTFGGESGRLFHNASET